MTAGEWSWLLISFSLVGFWLSAGPRPWRGWLLNAASEVLWFWYGLVGHAPGFVLGALAFEAIFLFNARRSWRRRKCA